METLYCEGGGVTALTNAVWAVPCVTKSPPEKAGTSSRTFGRHFPKNLNLPEIFSLLLHVSQKIFKDFRFMAKSSDSWKKFVFFSEMDILRVDIPPPPPLGKVWCFLIVSPELHIAVGNSLDSTVVCCYFIWVLLLLFNSCCFLTHVASMSEFTFGNTLSRNLPLAVYH